MTNTDGLRPVLRLATRADHALVADLCRAYRLADHQPLAPELVSSSLEAFFAGDPNIAIFLIELDAAVIGYLALCIGFSIEVGGRDAFVDELYVVDQHRRRGVGSRALEFAMAECQRRGVRRLNLEVERKNPRAKELYLRAGFRDHDRHLMSKRLPPL